MADDKFPGWHGTTILAVKRDGKVVVAGDGQVSVGQTVMKGTARKVRRLSPGGRDVVVGFAGSTADAFTLLERLEKKLEAAEEVFVGHCPAVRVLQQITRNDCIRHGFPRVVALWYLAWRRQRGLQALRHGFQPVCQFD